MEGKFSLFNIHHKAQHNFFGMRKRVFKYEIIVQCRRNRGCYLQCSGETRHYLRWYHIVVDIIEHRSDKHIEKFEDDNADRNNDYCQRFSRKR